MLWRQIENGPDGGPTDKKAKRLLEEEPRDLEGRPGARTRRTWTWTSVLEPNERSWTVKGTYVLVNKHDRKLRQGAGHDLAVVA